MIASLDLRTIARVLGGEVRGDEVLAPGPGHSKRDRSLCVKLAPNAPDGFLIHSFSPADDAIACKDHVRAKLVLEPFKANGANGHTRAAKPREVKAYDYVDENGELLYQVVRYEPKDFRQRRPDGKDGWIWNLDGIQRVPYRLPEVMEAKSNGYLICVVEGEKDADNLWKLNIPATTNCGGAGKWRGEYSETLRGAQVLIIPDNDKAGRANADQVGAALSGAASQIWRLDLASVWPACPPKGDISDWIEAGGTAEELWKFIDALPLWKPREEQSGAEAKGKEPESTPAQTFTAADLCTMVFEPIKYIVPGFIVEGLTLFAGKPKIGKSWLLMHAAWAVADSNYTLGGISCEGGDVLYAALEDNKRRLQSRMTKLFGTAHWPERLCFVNDMPRLASGGLGFIKTWIDSVKRPRLVIIDTLAMVRMPNRKDQNSYDADYAAVKDLRDLAAKHGVAILLVHHLRKAEADDPFDTISGTLGLTGAPDTVMIIYREFRRHTAPRAWARHRGHQEGSRVQFQYLHVEHHWRRRCSATVGRA